MRLQFLNGGLANQVFQYIFYRCGELRHPEEAWLLDDSFFFVHDVHNGYELSSVFGLRPRLLSEFFEPDVWDYMISLKKEENLSLPEILKQNGTELQMIAETSNWKEWNPFSGKVSLVPPNEFHPELLDVAGGDYYFHGYWINRDWFGLHEDVFRRELTFPEIADEKNRSFLARIEESASCSVHIRRGDYATLGFAIEDHFFADWIAKMLETVPDLTLFVFSDDLAYCRAHADALGLNLPKETVYVEGNAGKEAFCDLQLMSACKNMIISNSAFCYLAALLNQNLQHVVNPTARQI